MKFKGVFAALLAFLFAFALVGAPAHAARGAAVATVTLDSSAPASVPLAAAAADWSKRTDLSVQVGSCSGPLCVHFSVVQFPCGLGGVGSTVAGCAYRIADGGCQVEINGPVVVARGGALLEYTTKHELGHCLWSFSGNAHISYHLPGDRALMSAGTDYSVRRAVLTSEDRSFTRGLW